VVLLRLISETVGRSVQAHREVHVEQEAAEALGAPVLTTWRLTLTHGKVCHQSWNTS